MKSLELKVYEILKTRFSEKEAEAFIEYFESKTAEKIDEKKDVFLTKDDKVDLMKKINQSKTDTIKWKFSIFLALALMIIGLYLKK